MAPDMDLQRIRTRLIDNIRSHKPDSAKALCFLASLDPDGFWPDIDYVSPDPIHYPGRDHWTRLHAIALALETPSLSESAPDALPRMLRSIDYWLKHRFTSPNWWFNEISIPLAVLDLALLLDHHLEADRLKRLAVVFDQSAIGKTGQNFNWLATVALKRGVLECDPGRVEIAAAALHSVIVMGEGEGIQTDGSFHQHGACLYNVGYGSQFLEDTTLNALLLHGTRFAYAPWHITMLANLLLDGSALMMRGRAVDPGSAGRGISRANIAVNYDVVARRLLTIGTDRDEDLRVFLLCQAGEEPVRPRNKMFPRSDFMVHHRPGFYASARGYSALTINTDWPCNGEGLRSHSMGEGACFIMRSGAEYHPILPLWDWQHVPGTTVRQDNDYHPDRLRRQGESWFLGGASDGLHGAMGFRLIRAGLMAHKSWFFLDDRIICLGAGISDSAPEPVHTTLEQCRRNGVVLIGNEPREDVESDVVPCGRVWHNGMAWYVHEGSPLLIRHGMRRGRWSDINRGQSADEIAAPMLSLWFDHGSCPQDERYAYTVFPEC